MKKVAILLTAVVLFTLLMLLWPQKEASISPNAATSTASPKQPSSSSLSPSETSQTIDSEYIHDKPIQDDSAPNKQSQKELEKIGWLWGRVVDPDHQGIEDARIWAIIPEDLVGTTHFTTNKEGYFRLPQLENLPFSIFVSAKGYQGRNLNFPLPDTNSENVIQLKPGGELQIQIKDEWDQPIPGVTVQSSYADARVTDQNGFIQLYGMPDPANFRFIADGYNSLQKTLPLRDDVQTVTLLENGALIGQVLADPEGTPIQEFHIARRDIDYSQETYDFDDKDGYFEIQDLPRADQRFVFFSSGYLPEIFKAETLDPKRQTKPMEIRLSDQGIFFAGTITDKEQNPMANAMVTAFIGEELVSGTQPRSTIPKKTDDSWQYILSNWIGIVETTTDAMGQFKVGPLSENSFLGLHAEAEGFAPYFQHQAHALIATERLNLRISLESFGIVKVRVGQETYPGIRLLYVDFEDQGRRVFKLQPGEKEVLIADIHPGETFFRLFEDPQFAKESGIKAKLIHDMTTLQVASGEIYDLEIGVIEGFKLGGMINLDGFPMVHKKVTLNPKGGFMRPTSVKTDAHGNFLFENLKSGNYEVMANGSDTSRFFGKRNRQLVKLETDQPDLVFEFHANGSVFGRVPKEPENTTIMMKVSFKLSENITHGNTETTQLDDRKHFEFHQVPAGVFSLFKVMPHPQPPKPIILDVAMPDDGHDLDLGDLGDDEGILTLKLVAPSSESKMNVRIFQANPNGGISWESPLAILSPEKSSLTIEKLPLGPLHLKTASGFGYRVEPEEYQLVLSENEVASASFQLIPETFFQINLQNPALEEELIGGNLIEESTQKEWPMPFDRNSRWKPHDHQGPFLYLDRYRAYASDLPEGWWQIQLLNQEEFVATRRFQLIRGKPVTITLQDGDFKNVE